MKLRLIVCKDRLYCVRFDKFNKQWGGFVFIKNLPEPFDLDHEIKKYLVEASSAREDSDELVSGMFIKDYIIE